MDRTETELLLDTINLTMDDVYKIVGHAISKRYMEFPKLQSLETIDDMTQDVLIYCLSTMKSTGDIRLDHYIKKYNDRNHVISLLNMAAMQLPIYRLRRPDTKVNTVSLQQPIKTTNLEIAIEETIEDPLALLKLEKRLKKSILSKKVREIFIFFSLFINFEHN